MEKKYYACVKIQNQWRGIGPFRQAETAAHVAGAIAVMMQKFGEGVPAIALTQDSQDPDADPGTTENPLASPANQVLQ